MLIITNAEAMARALDSPIDPMLAALLSLRRDQLLADTADAYELGELAHFIVVHPGDTLASIENAAGYPVVTTVAFEWATDHGGWFEAVSILSDDGFGVVLLVPDLEGVEPTLLALCRETASHTPQMASDRAQQERGSATK